MAARLSTSIELPTLYICYALAIFDGPAATAAFDALLLVHTEAPDFGNSSRRQDRNQ
jgi:hypothetical protein